MARNKVKMWSRSRPSRKLPHFRYGGQTGVASQEDTARFLEGLPYVVESSWIESIQYFERREGLLIVLKSGTVSSYIPVGSWEALDLATASSKGKWIWDHIYVRGKGNGEHRQKTVFRGNVFTDEDVELLRDEDFENELFKRYYFDDPTPPSKPDPGFFKPVSRQN